MSSAVDQLAAQLPDGVSAPLTMKINPNMLPTMLFSVAVDGMDRAEASPYVEQKLLASFESVEGVATVGTTGLLENRIHVTLSADKIAALQAQLEENIDAAVQEAVDAGNQKITALTEQATLLTQEAYALQAQAEQAKTAITTAALRVVVDDVRAQLEEEIAALQSDVQIRLKIRSYRENLAKITVDNYFYKQADLDAIIQALDTLEEEMDGKTLIIN